MDVIFYFDIKKWPPKIDESVAMLLWGEEGITESIMEHGVVFFERKYLSSNMILIKDQPPILIDTGFGSDVKDTER